MSSFLSSELTTTFKTLVNTMAADIDGDAPVSRERFTTFSGEVSKIASAALAEATAAPSTPTKATAPASTDAPKKAPKKKLTTTKSAAPIDTAALLAPVDSDPATLAAPAVPVAAAAFVRDAYATHKSRLAKIDEALCMGRKIDVDNPVAGTRKGDAGATFQIYPELQCSKKPLPGGKLCKICASKHDEYKANTSKIPARYYGLLNEPMFPRALVVGCDMFFANYPNGIECDPTTAPIKAATTAAPAPAAKAEAAPAATATPAPAAKAEAAPAAKVEEVKAKKPRAKKTVASVPAEASTTASVAATETAPVEPEWVAFLHDDRVHMRNTKDGRVYEAHPGKTDRLEKVNFESYQGRWRDGALDIYAPEKDEE